MATRSLPLVMQALFIPDDSTPNKPIQEIHFASPASQNFKTSICQLLGCPLEEMEPMYSEELLSIFEGNETGLPSGQNFVAYEAYMDENGNSTRPKNSRVESLFSRPKSHGPMLIVKAVYAKDTVDAVPRVVRWEPLILSELENQSFREKRQIYAEKEAAYRKRLRAQYEAAGFITLSL